MALKDADIDKALRLSQIMEAATKFPEFQDMANEARKELDRMKQPQKAGLQAVRKPAEPVKVLGNPADEPVERKV